MRHAEKRLNLCLAYARDGEPQIDKILGAGADPAWDKIISSLGYVARRRPKPVIDSVMFWRKSKSEAAAAAAQYLATGVHSHSRTASESTTNRGVSDPREAAYQAETKSLISIFILCRVLMEVVHQTAPEVLDVDMSEKLEEIVFKQLRSADPVTLSRSKIRRANWNLFAELLGEMSRSRFMSVADRFIADIEKNINPVTKEAELKTEMVIKGMRYLQLKIYPEDALEESAEFVESLAKFFVKTHNSTLQVAYSEVLCEILAPVAGTATAEVNHPMWVAAVESIYARATEMAQKPKTWTVGFRLACMTLSTMPHEQFTANWFQLYEGNLGKLKEKTTRPIFFSGLSQLVWTFMLRCTESLNSTTRKLDAIRKSVLSNTSRKYWLANDSLMPAACIQLIRAGGAGYIEYFLENVLLQMVYSANPASEFLSLENVMPERAIIAVRAFTCILNDRANVKKPDFPSDKVLMLFAPTADCEPELPEKWPILPANAGASLREFYDTFGNVLCKLLTVLSSQYGNLSPTAASPTPEERLIQLRPQMSVSFHFGGDNGSSAQLQKQQSYIDLFCTILENLPWLLPADGNFTRAIEVLCKNVTHSNARIAQACTRSLECLARTRDTRTVVKIYTKLMLSFDEKIFTSYNCPIQSASETEPIIIKLYVRLINIWIEKIKDTKQEQTLVGQARGHVNASSSDSRSDGKLADSMFMNDLWSAVEDIEGNGLFFLCSQDRNIRHLAIQLLRLTVAFDEAIKEKDGKCSDANSSDKAVDPSSYRIINYLDSADAFSLLRKAKPPIDLSVAERSRMAKAYSSKKRPCLVRLAESDYGVDTALWLKVFPSLIAELFESYPIPVAVCRNIVCSRLVRMYDVVVEFARSENSATGSGPHAFITKHPMRTHPEIVVEQWRIYLVVACITLTLTDEQKMHIPDNHQQHGRKKSMQKITIHHQRITSIRSVFRMVIPLLGVDHPILRDAIVNGLQCINVNIYKALLECFNPTIESWREDAKRRQAGVPVTTPTGMHSLYSSQSSQSAQRGDYSGISGFMHRQDRIVTEITHILHLTSHFLESPTVLGDDWIMAEHLRLLDSLRWFLSQPDVQVDYHYQRLRRYYCGLVEAVYLATFNRQGTTTTQKPTSVSFEGRLNAFSLIEGWCLTGQHAAVARDREVTMRRAFLASCKDAREHNIALATMELENRKSDIAVISAMAALCKGPVADPETAKNKPGATAAHLAFDVHSVLKWINGLFESSSDEVHEVGRRALMNLLEHNQEYPLIFMETVANGYRDHPDSRAAKSYFVTLAKLLLANKEYPCELRQPLALGLFKTGDADPEVRNLAVELLSATELRFFGTTCLSEFEVSIANKTTAVFKRAMFSLSSRFAAEHPEETFMIFSELTKFFHVVNDIQRRDILVVLLPWIQTVELTRDVNENPTPSTAMVMNNLFEITVIFSDKIQNEVEALWVALGSGRYPANVNTVMSFIIHHSLVRRDPMFVEYARKIPVYLAATPAGSKLVDALLKYLEPKAMIPQHPEPYDLSAAQSQFPYVAEISSMLPAAAKEASFSHGQLAMILLVDLMLSPQENVRNNLPLLLHIGFVLFDHYLPIVHNQAKELLTHLAHEFSSKRQEASEFCTKLRKLDPKSTWQYDDLNSSKDGARTPKMMLQLATETLSLFSNDMPDLQEQWSRVALRWATTCPARHIACRSFQVFRCHLSVMDQRMLGDMLARLSNTVSDETHDIQGFAMQILMTLNAVTAELDAEELINYPQLFWATVACLSTIHEQEFIEALSILEKFIAKIDLESPDTVSCLVATFPQKWEGQFRGLQHAILPGLKSSAAYEQTLRVLDRLNQITPNEITADHSYLAIALVANLARFMHALQTGHVSSETEAAAMRLNEMCEERGLNNLARILVSLVKTRFRTKADFLLQTVSAIQNSFFADSEVEILLLLLGSLSNKIKWVKEETMEVLKCILPKVNMQREEFAGVGADIISPLLRLLQTDLAEQALSVLDETLSIPASHMDKHVLRMSLGSRALRKEYEKTATLFGIPDDSGWAVPNPQKMAATTRNNVHLVFYTCNNTKASAELASVPADEIQFHKEDAGYGYFGGVVERSDSLSIAEDVEGGSLSHMWTELDNLDTFFTKDMRRNINNVHRPVRHGHTMSVTDTEASTDIVNDPVESVPQLYDKKVSIILNRSLARTPSTTSFKTTLADSFGNSASSSTTTYAANTPLRREIDYNQMAPATSASTSDDDLDFGGPATAMTDEEDDEDSFQQAPPASSSLKFPYVGSQSNKTTSPRSSGQPAQESSFRLESLLRGNIRKGKKKEEKRSRSRSRSSGVKPNFSGKQRASGSLSHAASNQSLTSFSEQPPSPMNNRKGRELESNRKFQFPPAR